MRDRKKESNKGRPFNRPIFEALVHCEAKTVHDIIEMHKKGLISDHDYLFTLKSVKVISLAVYKGGWNNLREYAGNPKAQQARDAGTRNAKKFINDAFT